MLGKPRNGKTKKKVCIALDRHVCESRNKILQFLVRELVEAINKCEKLDFLDLEGNTLGVEAAVFIGKALEKHPEMKKALWKGKFNFINVLY